MNNKMKASAFFFLFSILFLAISMNKLQILSAQDLDAINLEYSFRVDVQYNTTYCYINPQGSNLDIMIQCFEWGVSFGGVFEGLVIEFRRDNDSALINSWLIQRGDMSEHHFTTEYPVTGIIQIVFFTLYVEFIDFNLAISEELPLWTYETHINLLEEGFFGIERSINDYDTIDKLFLILQKDYWTTFNFSLEIYNEFYTLLENITYTFDQPYFKAIEIEVDAGLEASRWYSIRLNTIDLTNQTHIRLKYYYDHYQFANLGRIFLNTADKQIYEIPIDLSHSDSSYIWYIEDEDRIIDYPPDFDPLIIVLKVITYVIYTGLYGTAFVLLAKYLLRRRKEKKHGQMSQPSQKYNQMENQHATYNPAPVYGVNFTQLNDDFSLESDEASKVMCSICMQTISKKASLIRCPSCDVAFHKNHLQQWIVTKNNCPACKANLRITKN